MNITHNLMAHRSRLGHCHLLPRLGANMSVTDKAQVRAELKIDVPVIFKDYVNEALIRFQYLYPNVDLHINGEEIWAMVGAAEGVAVKRDFLFCLYRQRIYDKAFSLRTRLMEGVMGK
jgi:hypothetical protein